MKVAWQGIYDRGNIQVERVHFRALVDLQLNFYAIYDTNYQAMFGNSINVLQKSCYWFSSFNVKAGQNVVLYTRVGNYTTETRPDGSVFHFFFRGLENPLYTDVNRCAVVFEINNWATTAWGA